MPGFNWMGDYASGSGWMDGLGSSDWGDMFDTGYTSDWSWGDLFGGGSGGSSSGGWGDFFSNLLGGDNDSSGGNIWSQILAGGLNGMAEAGLTEEMLKQKGKQDRMSTGFEAELVDFYKQKDKSRRRTALDTYGQFSTMNRWAPNATPAAAVDVPNKPVA